MSELNVILLHDGMVDKQQKPISASLTLIDVHDIARSARTYGVAQYFISHSSPAMRKLARTIQHHWQDGFGATYNPNRTEALGTIAIVTSIDEAMQMIHSRTGLMPILVATSAREGGARVSFAELRQRISVESRPYLLMLGTGWGMGPELLARAELFLEPIRGAGDYNHLSVRSACAIMLDRLRSPNCMLVPESNGPT